MSRERKLEEIVAAARLELSAIDDEKWVGENAKIVGRFFKSKNNYSCPEGDPDYWDTYIAVIDMDESGRLEIARFQIDKYGKINMGKEFCGRKFFFDEEITREEFVAAWSDTLTSVIDFGRLW